MVRQLSQESGGAKFKAWQGHLLDRRELGFGHQQVGYRDFISGDAEIYCCGVTSLRRVGEAVELHVRISSATAKPPAHSQAFE